MFFLNLSALEFLALLGAASALVVTLYLLHRSRRRQTVATLRFWKAAQQPIASAHKRRIQQPFSLLLQLLCIALLLLAIAQLRIGSADSAARDHVLILDTSAWMEARRAKGTLMQEAKAAAHAYIHALPPGDRVMLVRADGLAIPATAFEKNRERLDAAIDSSRPSASALNLNQALQFASEVQHLSAQNPGEIVFAGTGRLAEGDGALQGTRLDRPLRVLPISPPGENCGIRKIGVRASQADPGLWEAFVSVRNYGRLHRAVPLVLAFGNAPVGSRRLELGSNQEQEASFQFRTRAAGYLEATLLVNDAFADDNHAVLELPSQQPLKVVVYTDEPGLLRPALSANPRVEAEYLSPSQYDPKKQAGIVVFDRFRPAELPNRNTIWVEPPKDARVVNVQEIVTDVPITTWRAAHELGTGLRSKQLKLETAEVFAPAPGDIAVAEVDAGPVIMVRPGAVRSAFIGFHPGRSQAKYDLAIPLVFANLLRWMEPSVFRRAEVFAGSVGMTNVQVDSDADAAAIRVLDDRGQQLPFSIQSGVLRFYSGAPGTVRVLMDSKEQVYSLTLPDVGTVPWQAPANAIRGLPARVLTGGSQDVWQALTIMAALGLLAEWWLFGRPSRSRTAAALPQVHFWRKAS